MSPYLLVEDLLVPVLWAATPRAVGNPAILRRHIPHRGDEEFAVPPPTCAPEAEKSPLPLSGRGRQACPP